jgi:23S rRNA (guanine745-N1)-methyltransferase
VARSGYVNLLQPQDRRSRLAGDARAALDARSRLLDAGIGSEVLERFVSCAATRLATGAGVVAELGCGYGDALARLHDRRGMPGVGIDLAAPAIEVAARRVRSLTWVVANADRRLPLRDASIAVLLSLHARRNPDEAQRVLPPGAHLVVAVPAPDDLIELRAAIQGTAAQRDRVAGVLGEHAAAFDLVHHETVRERHLLTGDQLRDLLRGTYRGERVRYAERVQSVSDLQVTLASDVLVLRRR